ncbi:MAG: CDP-alcohol phosphatidyltransferase family protein [Slackia sp.]|nr:CDP-alcohol phosphatidyltransferase family protein [Slackia sp.]
MTNREEVTSRIFTLANVVSFIRLCMVPAYLVLLLDGHDVLAAFLFALAASTDFVDGQLARRTHTVSRLGQLLDPAVDRILMIAGVVGLLLVGRLPLWIIVVVVVRDALLLAGGAFLLKRKKRVAVVFMGKVATTLLFVGFAGLLLNLPLIPGLGICDIAWLPGFNGLDVSWGIWFVYGGLALALVTTVIYVRKGIEALSGNDTHTA